MNITNLRLVTFDIVGTVLRFKQPPVMTYRDVGLQHGVAVDLPRLENSFRLQYKRMEKEHPHYGSTTNLSSDQWWVTLVRETFRGVVSEETWDPEKVEEIASQLYRYYHSAEAYQVIEGTADLLKRFKDENKTIGVISNFDNRIHDIVTYVGLREFLDFVVSSEDAKSSKPESKIFKMAVGKSGLSCLTSDQILHIGDDFRRDYLGARALKWNTMLLDKMGVIGYSVQNGPLAWENITDVFQNSN